MDDSVTKILVDRRDALMKENDELRKNVATAGPVVIHYHQGFLGRASAALRMLAEAGIEHEWKMDYGSLSSKGAPTDTFAPPMVELGTGKLSQCIPVAIDVGRR